MPNFALLVPVLVYVPVIILVLVATIVGVTHCIIAWPERRPAALIAVQGQVPVGNAVRNRGLPDGSSRRGISAAIRVNNFAGLERA